MMDRTQSNRNHSNAARLAAYTAAAGGAFAAASGTHAAVTIFDLAPAQTGIGIGFSLDFAMTSGSGEFSVSAVTGSQFKWNMTGGQGPKVGLFAVQRWDGGLLGSGANISNAMPNGGTWVGRAGTSKAPWGNETMSLPAGATGYIGFRVPVAEPGDWRYGWIELKNVAGTLTVDRWAYESDFNTAIQTPTASAVPGGAGLAALAFGAAGLRGRRRSRN